MPIYAYRCESCGHAQDVLQKISDPLLTVCPVCGNETYKKQVTAAGFQLKGSGWYVTDFRNNASAAPAAAAAGSKSEGDGGSGASTTEAGAAGKSDAAGDAKPASGKASESKADSSSAVASESKPAPGKADNKPSGTSNSGSGSAPA